MNLRKTAIALAAVTAVAAPAAASADKGGVPNAHAGDHASAASEHTTGKPEWAGSGGRGIGPAKGVAYVFKGTYAGEGVVSVTRGNAHVRKADLVDTDVAFDLSAARLSVADTNGDSAVTLDDVAVGDKVVVKAKLAKGGPGEGPYAARQLVDQTNPAEDVVEEPVVEPVTE
jgi:hypothetical protein